MFLIDCSIVIITVMISFCVDSVVHVNILPSIRIVVNCNIQLAIKRFLLSCANYVCNITERYCCETEQGHGLD